MSRNESGRRPVEIIEIDQDICVNEYGDSNCDAVLAVGLEKCFNTITTCQSVGDYDADELTIRFCKDQMDMPQDAQYFPFLSSVRVRPGTINPGGAGRNSGPLGTRAQITASFTDHPAVDRVVDPYYAERLSGAARDDGIGYDPAERSTFWRKWRARNQYYMHRKIRYISGYLDEDGNVVDAVTRHFVITGFTGPDRNGAVSIEGKDVLTLAQREKAKAPLASPGKLVSAITAGSSSLSLNPVGVGDAEYPASGYACIGSEIVSFTRSGDSVTLSGRGQYNTEASSHSSGDTFQLCWVVTGEDVPDILYPLLNTYAGIDAAFLDYTQWTTEAATYLPLSYSVVVAKPEDVEKLLSEMCEQMHFYLWFDEIDNKVKIRSIRPADGETVTTITEGQNVIADSVSIKDMTDEVLTRVVVNYGIRNPVEGLDEPSNYLVTDIFGNLAEEGDDRGRISKTKTIFSRWLDNTAGAQVEDLGDRLLARYKAPPVQITFAMDAKDRDLWLADFIAFEDRKLVGPTGLPVPAGAQIMGVTEAEAGTRFEYTAQQFLFELPPQPGDKALELSADDYNINLRDLYDLRFSVAPTDSDTVTLTIRPGVVLGSTSTAIPALEVLDADWPSGTTITVIVGSGSYIVGKGGNGGASGGTAAGAGGTAIYTDRAISIDNAAGVIGGGGGGGADLTNASVPGVGGGGGGGAGRNGGAGGAGGANSPSDADGHNGSLTTGGDGGIASFSIEAGAGGNLGQPGETPAESGSLEAGTPGAAGNAVDGVSNVTYINKGDVRGPEIN